MSLLDAARAYFDKGYVPLALGPDANGFSKRPLALAWTDIPLDWEQIEAQPWRQATGIGLQLGPHSGNLAAIDIDDEDLAAAAFAYLVRHHQYTRMVWTVRRRIHVFVQEENASPSRKVGCVFEGRNVSVELKATGTQVATVPTPKYVLACDRAPLAVPHLTGFWAAMAKALGITFRKLDEVGSEYPRPWKAMVPAGDRNKAAYVEAHRLREAGIPLDQALNLMSHRWTEHYEPGQTTWEEIAATIKSAYRKGPPPGQSIGGWNR